MVLLLLLVVVLVAASSCSSSTADFDDRDTGTETDWRRLEVQSRRVIFFSISYLFIGKIDPPQEPR